MSKIYLQVLKFCFQTRYSIWNDKWFRNATEQCMSISMQHKLILFINICRDPKSINSHVYLPWTKVVTEPTSFRKLFCQCSLYFGLFRFVIRPPWDVSRGIFYKSSQGKQHCWYVSFNQFKSSNITRVVQLNFRNGQWKN